LAYEPKLGDGVLFENDRKTSDKQPDARGYVVAHRNIKAGERLELAAWNKSSSRGAFQSLKMSDPREKQDKPVADNTRMGGGGETSYGPHGLDDSIPFITPWGNR
jgi:uncharacterized protein (DUF736 family)